jgi:hypothetical protein
MPGPMRDYLSANKDLLVYTKKVGNVQKRTQVGFYDHNLTYRSLLANNFVTEGNGDPRIIITSLEEPHFEDLPPPPVKKLAADNKDDSSVDEEKKEEEEGKEEKNEDSSEEGKDPQDIPTDDELLEKAEKTYRPKGK